MTDSLFARYPDAVESVRRFFAQFFDSDLSETEDLESDSIILAVGPERSVVLSADFLGEYGGDEIYEKLTGWNVAALSQTLEAHSRLNITPDGIDVESDAF